MRRRAAYANVALAERNRLRRQPLERAREGALVDAGPDARRRHRVEAVVRGLVAPERGADILLFGA